MNDLINRKEAVEAIKNEMLSWLDGDSHDYRNVVDAIMDLPSAQQWIPCSERLPKKTGLYYVTIRDEDGTEYTSCMCYYINLARWEVDVNVIAWLPEPEPYKEGE